MEVRLPEIKELITREVPQPLFDAIISVYYNIGAANAPSLVSTVAPASGRLPGWVVWLRHQKEGARTPPTCTCPPPRPTRVPQWRVINANSYVGDGPGTPQALFATWMLFVYSDHVVQRGLVRRWVRVSVYVRWWWCVCVCGGAGRWCSTAWCAWSA